MGRSVRERYKQLSGTAARTTEQGPEGESPKGQPKGVHSERRVGFSREVTRDTRKTGFMAQSWF